MSDTTMPPLVMDRISIDRADAAYRDDHYKFVVLLDGERVPYAITAYKRAGYVIWTQTDKDGMPVHDGEQFVLCRKVGSVDIVPVESWRNRSTSLAHELRQSEDATYEQSYLSSI